MAACRMQTPMTHHLPVLLADAVTELRLRPDGIYIDATFGRGGHASALLKALGPHGRLIAIDKDPEAISYAEAQFGHDARFKIFHGSYAELNTIIANLNLIGKIDGILFDLGVSSPQLDDAARGFSFLRDGPLDMRMNFKAGLSAQDWLQNVPEQALATVLWEYGEERYSRRIAKAIVMQRQTAPIISTRQLAEIAKAAIPRWEKDKHPATRTFQAIRIAINNELTDLTAALAQSLEVLAIGGRLAVISFHSLEDRIVKRFIRQHEKGGDFPAGLPVRQDAFNPRLKRIGRAIKPNSAEISRNPRARSAVLRIAEKLS